MINELFDVQYLPDYDYDKSRIIREQDFDSFSQLIINTRNYGPYIKNVMPQAQSGEIYVITGGTINIKLYVLYLNVGGVDMGMPLQYLNLENGDETIYNLTQGDYQALKQSPLFAGENDDELAFFFAAQYISGMNYTPDAAGTTLVTGMLNFSNKGLWYCTADPSFDFESLNVVDKYDDKKVIDIFGGKIVAVGNLVVGPYEVIKKLYLNGDNRNVMKFGGNVQEGYVASLVNDYDGYLNREVNIEKKEEEQQVISETPAMQTPEQQAEVMKQEEASWDAMESLLIEEQKPKKSKASKSFSIEKEISQDEKNMAAKQVASEPAAKIKVKKRTKNIDFVPIDINKAIVNVGSVNTVAPPADVDYVYTLEETSAMYNPTVGKTYIKNRSQWVDDEGQKIGMTIAEWNAYFFAHPEYSHLISPAIGHWGGMTYDEKKLREEGVLLYNPRSKKLEYIYEYLKGNAYDLLDDTIAAKEYIIAEYGQEFYELQESKIKSVTPDKRNINDADSSKVPFIHPLDDIISNIKITTAGGIQFPRAFNSKLVAQHRKFIAEQKKSARAAKSQAVPGVLPMSTDATAQQEMESEEQWITQPQQLNIIAFFKRWISDPKNHGIYYSKFEVPFPRPVKYTSIKGYDIATEGDYDAVAEFYFGNAGFNDFAGLVSSGADSWSPNFINPETGLRYTNPKEVSKSAYFEFKDDLKKMVNFAFQNFIQNELEPENIEAINDAWNRRYNGFIKLDVYKYPIFLRHRKYFKDATKRIKFMLDKSQVEGIKFAVINNSSIMAHEVGYGKAQTLDSKILTPTGWKLMGDIKVGDEVISVDGKPTKVSGIYPQGEKDIYKVTFDDGGSTDCCDEHLWSVNDTTRKNKGRDSLVLSLKQMMDKNLELPVSGTKSNAFRQYKFKTYYKEKVNNTTRNKWQIPVIQPAQFHKQNLPVHPYLIGALIGDGGIGDKSSIKFSSVDNQILDNFRKYAGTAVVMNFIATTKYDYRITRNQEQIEGSNYILDGLRKLGLQGTKSHTKFIPEIYKFSSVEDRISLLHGLMDTDGTSKIIRGRNSAQLSYTTVSERLKDDFVFLIRSLGGIATVSSRKPTYTYKGEKKRGKLAYTININLPENIIPFSLQRKIDKHIPKNKYAPTRFISDIEYIGKKQAQCISVEHPSQLYVTDDFIVTHNTTLSIAYMSHMFETNQANNVMVAVPKTLYDNNKWKEEIVGSDDGKILGILSPADYNFVGLQNLSPGFVLGGIKTDRTGGGKKLVNVNPKNIKTYSYAEVVNIEDFAQMKKDIEDGGYGDDVTGDKARVKKFIKLMTDKDGWLDKVEEAKKMDSVLYKNCSGPMNRYTDYIAMLLTDYDKRKSEVDFQEALLRYIVAYDILEANFDGGKEQPETSNEQNIFNLINSLVKKIETEKSLNDEAIAFAKQEFYEMSKGDYSAAYKRIVDKRLEAYLYKRDDDGKKIYAVVNVNGVDMSIAQENKPEDVLVLYMMDVAERIYDAMVVLFKRMHENAIYEYGNWNFNISNRNIFLVTHEALKCIGFSNSSIENVKQRIAEFSSYQEDLTVQNLVAEQADEENTYVQVVEGSGTSTGKGVKSFVRKQRKVIEEQYAVILREVEENMSYNSDRGKLMVDSLGIDGFIFDEAHKGKKLFTNAVTNSKFAYVDENGKISTISKSSHDIHGGSPSNMAVQMFGISQYVRSLGDNKPVMLLTATPFSNQPTEIFTMLAMVGVKQLRQQGVANVKNFFDLFLNESLKYTFDHTGQFVKRIAVEDFRNKELLLQMIWSVMDIKREASKARSEEERIREEERLRKLGFLDEDSKDKKSNNLKPKLYVLPELNSATSYKIANAKNADEARKRDKTKDCDDFKQVTTSTTSQLKQDLRMVASIVNRNRIQEEIMADLEKVALALPNPKNPVMDANGQPVVDDNGNPKYHPYTFADICPDVVIENEGESKEDAPLSQTNAAIDNQKVITKRSNEGRVFKTLGLSQSVALSPYFYNCYDLPEPTPENIIKTSPKLEYLVKALASVKNYHTNDIPKLIKGKEKQIADIKAKINAGKATPEEIKVLDSLNTQLPKLKAALKISGQVVYLNKVRFKYKGKEYNLVKLVKQYLVNKGIFSADQIGYVGTGADGGRAEVEKNIKDFQDGKLLVLFGTPAIREGVDLQQNGSIVYILTPDWNPTDMRQIEGRIWRRGNPYAGIRIVYILLDQSVEIFIYAKLEEKKNRLQKIMQERNYMEELEEMSLDPKETQIALASNPRRRVDIITKTCLEILKERRLKLEANSNALQTIVEVSGQAAQNIDSYYQDYYLGYYDAEIEFFMQYKRMVENELYSKLQNDKNSFINAFCQNLMNDALTGAENNIYRNKVEAIPSELLKLSIFAVAQGIEVDGLDYAGKSGLFTSYDNNMMAEYLMCLKAVLDNRASFLNHAGNDYDLLNQLCPMSYVNDVRRSEIVRQNIIEKTGRLFNFSYINNVRSYVNNIMPLNLFNLHTIKYLPSHLVKYISEGVQSIIDSKDTNRISVVRELEALIPRVKDDLTGIVRADASSGNGFVKIENTYQIIHTDEYIAHLNQVKKELEEYWSKYNILQKAARIASFHDSIVNYRIIVPIKAAPKAKRDALEAGRIPKQSSILDFKNDKYFVIGINMGVIGNIQGYRDVLDPILKLGSNANTIRGELAAAGISDSNQIKVIYEQSLDALDEVTRSINEVEMSKDILLDKYTKELEEKKKITLDEVIDAFSKTNPILENRQPDQN